MVASSALAVAAPSTSAEAWVQTLNQQFNAIKTAYAPFTQTNPNGSTVSGRWFLSKPGKMRFEYDDPNQPMMIANGQQIAVFDNKSNTGPKKYPQLDSPLSLLARNNLDLMGTHYVQKIQKTGNNEALVTVTDPNRAQYGSLIIRTNLSSGALLGWQSVDRAGNKTTITLRDFRSGIAMNEDLFTF